MDGFSGFPYLLCAIYPQMGIQFCIVRMAGNPAKFVSCKDFKKFYADPNRFIPLLPGESALTPWKI
jgi:transposase-like protein